MNYKVSQSLEVVSLPVMVDNMDIEFQQPKCNCRGRKEMWDQCNPIFGLVLVRRVQRDRAAANFGASFPFNPSISRLSLWHWILWTRHDQLFYLFIRLFSHWWALVSQVGGSVGGGCFVLAKISPKHQCFYCRHLFKVCKSAVENVIRISTSCRDPPIARHIALRWSYKKLT